jgi:hypothetical protein
MHTCNNLVHQELAGPQNDPCAVLGQALDRVVVQHLKELRLAELQELLEHHLRRVLLHLQDLLAEHIYIYVCLYVCYVCVCVMYVCMYVRLSKCVLFRSRVCKHMQSCTVAAARLEHLLAEDT